jgi:prepilin-type N-terminal cleavage/methylation domain-containing protein
MSPAASPVPPTPVAASRAARGAGFSSGFTLTELLVSMAIAMVMAALASTSFLQVRAAMNRAQARLTMHAAAQTVFTTLHQQFLSTQQSCAFVITTTRSGGTPEDGQVRLIFMRGKQDTKDFDWYADKLGDSDLLWCEWVWRRASGTLSTADNQPLRDYRVQDSELPSPFAPGGQSYDQVRFTAVPQPRRRLDPLQPTTTLDDDIYFPKPGTVPAGESDPRAVSLASVDDVGDFSDLQRRLTPVLTQVSDFAIEVVAHDGSLAAYDDGATATSVRQGVWPDGRLTPLLDPTPATRPTPAQLAAQFAASDAAKRPKLVRLRFTITDRRLKLSQVFSFSFALPGMLPPP